MCAHRRARGLRLSVNYGTRVAIGQTPRHIRTKQTGWLDNDRDPCPDRHRPQPHPVPAYDARPTLPKHPWHHRKRPRDRHLHSDHTRIHRSRRLSRRLQHGSWRRSRRVRHRRKNPARGRGSHDRTRPPEQNGHFALLFYAGGGTPISAQIALPALLLSAPHAGSIHIDVPAVPAFPGAPNVAIAELNATLGPRGLTYYERIHGKLTSYHPTGILLPDQCPRGGFPFAASLAFEDGSSATARTAVPCAGSRKPR